MGKPLWNDRYNPCKGCPDRYPACSGKCEKPEFLAFEPDFVTDADISAFDQQEVEVGDMLVMKTANDTFQPGWLASQADMLAEDWFVVE